MFFLLPCALKIQAGFAMTKQKLARTTLICCGLIFLFLILEGLVAKGLYLNDVMEI